MTNIALLGAGSLGFRYLQGLINSKESYHITVIDPSVESLSIAEKEFAKATDHSDQTLQTSVKFSDLPKNLDLVICATQSAHRISAIQEARNSSSVGAWLVEKLLAPSKSDLKELCKLLEHQAAWVNTPRRYFPFYGELKRKLKFDEALKLDVTGGNWGLASNSIHFLDLFEFMSNSKSILKNSCSDDLKIVSSKRKGVSELTGKLAFEFESNRAVSFESNRSNNPVILRFSMDELVVSVQEIEGSIIASVDGEKILEGSLPFQSQITPTILKDILNTGECLLPSFNDSALQHDLLFDAFKKHARIELGVGNVYFT